MSSQPFDRVEELRQAALARVRAEEYDEALVLYDEALALVDDDEKRELLIINKADAMIALDINGPELQQLPAILMRRRNLHHAFLAAYALMFRHRTKNDTKRGIFYGQLALDLATESEQPAWKLGALNDLGIVYEMDSQFENAIACFDEALALINSAGMSAEFERTALIGNLGYNKILTGSTVEGIELILSIFDKIEGRGAKAELCVDLCFGYLDLEDLDQASRYGALGLELAVDPRQIRNAHYLLGEVSYKRGDVDAAEGHFEELAKFYPQFRNLKSLLFAIDLRGMVNLKL